jgi:indole-3-glycerol phosphate synthase
MMKHVIQAVINGENLDFETAKTVMNAMMDGTATQAQIGALLTGLRIKGETVEAALAARARVIGVNNRNLHDFTVDIYNSIRLRKLVPESVLFVAESGIKTAADVARLRQAKVNGLLIGETLMRSPEKRAMLDRLRGKIK